MIRLLELIKTQIDLAQKIVMRYMIEKNSENKKLKLKIVFS
jgi:hypothetical protein